MPSRDIFSVRGIGVAESVSTSTFFFSCLSFSLCADPETLLFVDDDEAEFWQFHIVRKDAVRADEDIDLAFSGRFGH